MAWADSVKKEGNDLYAKKMFKEAMEKYTEALTAADFGNKTRLAILLFIRFLLVLLFYLVMVTWTT